MNSRAKKNFGTVDSLAGFGYILLIGQLVLLLLFALFVRMRIAPPHPLSPEQLLGFLATNLMAVTGMGLFCSFAGNYQFSPLSSALLCVSLSWQLYVFWYPFWLRLFNGFHNYPTSIEVDLWLLLRAARSGLAAVVALGASDGRLSYRDVIKMVLVLVPFYTCTEAVIQEKIRAVDGGGTMTVFGFAGTFALVFSFVLGKKIGPVSSAQDSYRSIGWGFVGTGLLWVCWPVFNLAFSAKNEFEAQLAATNTFLAMAGSCLAMAALSSLYREGISLLIMQRSTMVGGIAVGCCSHYIYHSGLAILIGVMTGVCVFFSLRHLQGRFEMGWGLYDTHGVMSYAVIPSLLGATASCLLLVAYDNNGYDDKVAALSSPTGIFGDWQTLRRKSGFQAGAAFAALGIGVFAGLAAGMLVGCTYREHPEVFYQDDWHFDVVEQEDAKTEYELEAGTRHKSSSRYPAPESSERFPVNQPQEGGSQERPKKKFKTRFAT